MAYCHPIFTGDENMGKWLAYSFILLGATLWGLIAFFVKGLSSFQFTSMEITAIRAFSAFLFLFFFAVIKYRKEVSVQPKHIPLFIGTGIFSVTFFNWCYFTAIEEMSISMAVILLYTAPAFVAILSYFILKESMNVKKIVAIVGTIIGCAFVSGITDTSSSVITPYGFIVGLGSGLGYAFYTIFSKMALKNYSPFTITLYTFVIASIFLIPFTQLWEKSQMFLDMEVLFLSLGLGLLPTVGAYMLYTTGLKYVEGSTASMLATVEPIAAFLLGILVYHEVLTVYQVFGAIIIVLSVIFVNYERKLK